MAYADKDKERAYRKKWKKKNRLKLLEQAKAYRAANREKYRLYDRNYRLNKDKDYFRYAKCVCAICKNEFLGWRKSNKFCSRKCMGLAWAKPEVNKYTNTSKNYKRTPDHRLVMEKMIGRKLKPEEVVHHINCNRRDNRPENLMLFKSNAEHIKHHRKIEREQKLQKHLGR